MRRPWVSCESILKASLASGPFFFFSFSTFFFTELLDLNPYEPDLETVFQIAQLSRPPPLIIMGKSNLLSSLVLGACFFLGSSSLVNAARCNADK